MESSNTPTPEPQPSPRRRGHTAVQKAVLAVNIVVVLGCLIAAVGLLYAKSQLDGRLQADRVDVSTTIAATTTAPPPGETAGPSTAPPETFPPADPAAKNFLIAGSDNNPCVEPNSPWAGAADPQRENIGSRSDTIMVVRVDPTTNSAAILSFPRDLWVKIPTKGNSRINAAYVKDDYSLLAQTLYNNFGVVVDHYIQVDFCAFKRIVDGVGGVSVPFNTPIIDRAVALDVAPAAGEGYPFCHTFSGDEALAYVRSRHLKWVDEDGTTHEDPASDFGRISRQQDFLRRVLQRALDKGLFDPAVARALIESLQTDIVTEAGFTVRDMLTFAGVMRNVDPLSIRTYQVDSTSANIGGAAVRIPAIKGSNMKAILAIFRGEAPIAAAPAEQVLDTATTAAPAPATATTTVAVPTTATPVSVTVPATAPVTGSIVIPDENGKGEILPPKDVHC